MIFRQSGSMMLLPSEARARISEPYDHHLHRGVLEQPGCLISRSDDHDLHPSVFDQTEALALFAMHTQRTRWMPSKRGKMHERVTRGV